MKIYCKSDNLGSVVSNGLVYQPWRYQKTLQIVVPFSVYLEHIYTLTGRNECLLRFKYDYYLKNYRDLECMKRTFAYDISSAIAVELTMALIADQDATRITHCYDDNEEYSVLSYLDVPRELFNVKSEHYNVAVRSLQNDIRNQIPLTQKALKSSVHNLGVYAQAVLLRLVYFGYYNKFSFEEEEIYVESHKSH